MRRLARSTAAALFLLGIGGMVATASPSNTPPVVTGLDAHLVTPNQFLAISGNNFSYDPIGRGDCSFTGAPSVNFTPLNGAPQVHVALAGTDAAHCTNTTIHVAVPGSLLGGARVSVVDPSNNESNNNQVVTLLPAASINPSAGPVGTTASVQGSGLRPASLATPSGVSLTLAGSPRGFADSSWTDNSLPFDPQNASGNVVLSFNVVNDTNRPSSDPGNLSRVSFSPGGFTFQPPAPDQVQFTHQTVGSRLHVSGRYLGSGGSVTFPGGGSQGGSSWNSSGFDVSVPPGAQNGQLTVSVNGYGAVPGPSLQLDPKVLAMSPTSASAGQQVRLTGYNFGNSRGQVRVGSTDQPLASWGDQGVTFTLNPDTDGGVVALTRSDGVAVNAPNLSILPRIDRFESPNVAPGGQVVVDGVGLGSGTGTATLGGSDAQPLLWSRTSVLLQVPPTLSPGSYPVTLVNASGARTNALRLTVIAAPTQAPGTKPGSTIAQPGSLLAPNFDLNHDFVKPIKPPSPVFFNITTDPHKVRAGESADVVVVLKLNDKPLSGAQVQLSMLFTPGNDYTFTPASGVTDATGTFRSRVKVSKTPGDSVIAATSGVFSDQDHVAGTGADGKTVKAATQTNPAAQNSGFAPLAIIGVLAVALVAAGFYLNVRSMTAA